MTDDERMELEELRHFKLQNEGKALNRSFSRLDQLLQLAHYDGAQSVRGFRVIAECLIALKDELKRG